MHPTQLEDKHANLTPGRVTMVAQQFGCGYSLKTDFLRGKQDAETEEQET